MRFFVLTVSATLLALPQARVDAQRPDSARVGVAARPDSARRVTTPRGQPPRDTLAPPISSRRAFLSSLALPGYGQARLDRPSAGAVYAAFEMVSIAMLAKSAADLRLAKRRVKETIVTGYAVDGSGQPQFDSTGAIIVKDTLINRYAPSGDDQRRSRLKARRLHYEDWIAMVVFNHLFSAADAFVSAHLWDLPKRVEIRRLPSGAAGVGASWSFR